MIEVKRRLLSRKPSAYEVEYIEADGEQYIDTGYVPKQNTRVLMLFDATGSGTDISGLMGARKDTNSEAYTVWLFEGNKIGGQYKNNAYNSNPIELDYNQRILYELYEYGLWAGTERVSHEQDSENYPIPECNLTLFAVNTNGNVDARRTKGKLYLCQIYEDETLIRDYIPTVYEGKACLYDKVNDTYTYSSSGKFIAGPKTEEIQRNILIQEQDGGVLFNQEILPSLEPGQNITLFIDFDNIDSLISSSIRVLGINVNLAEDPYLIGSAYTMTDPIRFFKTGSIPLISTISKVAKGDVRGHHKVIVSITRGQTGKDAEAILYADGIKGVSYGTIKDSNFESAVKILNAEMAEDGTLDSIGFQGTYHEISILPSSLTELQMEKLSFN